MTGLRIVSVGYTDYTVMLDADSEVRVLPDRTIALESAGLRRLTVVGGDICDEKITDPRERELLTRLFIEDD